ATVGHPPAPSARRRVADLLLAVGARLGDIATRGYTTLAPPRTPQTFVHVYADPDELGRVYEPDVPIVADSTAFVAGMRALPPLDGSARAAWTESAHSAYLASLEHARGASELDLGD